MENRKHCEHIAKELEAYSNGCIYRYNSNLYNIEELEEIENDEGYSGYIIDDEFVEENELEQLSVYDFFDDCFDIEYRIGSDGEYRSVCIMVACGGPNIYINTRTKQVELYWWSDTASFPIDYDVVNEIDNIFSELYQCSR